MVCICDNSILQGLIVLSVTQFTFPNNGLSNILIKTESDMNNKTRKRKEN